MLGCNLGFLLTANSETLILIRLSQRSLTSEEVI